MWPARLTTVGKDRSNSKLLQRHRTVIQALAMT
jgi:hypothetical protein